MTKKIVLVLMFAWTGIAWGSFVSLASTSMTGTLPDSLSALTSLSWLSLMGNGLSGTLPSNYSTLTNLL